GVPFPSRSSNHMMRPLQLWLPLLHSTASTPARQRDQQRAFEAWRGEQTVWLIPGLEQPYRWNEDPDCLDWRLAVPAAALERVDVYHLDRHGHVYGRASQQWFPAGRVTGLLADWLNTSPELVLAPIIPELRLRVPTF